LQVLESWRNKFASTPNYKAMAKYIQEVELCIIIALTCLDPDMEKRPTTRDIIQLLNAADQVWVYGVLISY
jgi:hypothetical protein